MTAARTTPNPVSEHGARVAAGKIGCTVAEYRAHEAAGERWCAIGQHWAEKRNADRCRACANAEARARYTPQRAHVLGLRGVRYAGPAFARGARVALTPEGAVAVSRADSAWSEPTASCAQPAAAPSGYPDLDREWVDAMKRRVTRLGRPHGSGCSCLMCVDARGEAPCQS